MSKRVKLLTNEEKECFLTEYPHLRGTFQNKGIRRFILAVVCLAIHLIFPIQLALTERLLELLILMFLIGMIKSFAHVRMLDRIYEHFERYY